MKKVLLILISLMIVLPSNAFWTKKDKSLELELQGKGYAGTLPDISTKSNKKENAISSPVFESQKNFTDPSDLKPVPRDNPAYVDVILKKDKVSEFVNDANEIIPILEKLADSIENECDIQLFVTRANILVMNLDYLIKKYEGKPESYYEAFIKLTEINRYTKTIMQLRQEAQVYKRYLAYQASGSIYNPENINQQLQYLLEEINQTVLLLRQEN